MAIFNRNPQNEAAKSVFQSSMNGLADTVAVGITFVGLPEAYSRTAPWVAQYTATRYGPEFTDISQVAWFVLLGFFIFFGARGSVSTLIMMGTFAAASKLF